MPEPVVQSETPVDLAPTTVGASEVGIGQRIREARTTRGMSQNQLGAAVGLNQVVISRIETGDRGCDVTEFIRIADALGTFPSVLLGEPSQSLALSSLVTAVAGTHRRLAQAQAQIVDLMQGVMTDIDRANGALARIAKLEADHA